MKNDTKELYEAPASATLSVVTPKGFNTLFTLRDTSGKDLLEKITALENKLEELGYKPQVKGFVKREKVFVEGKACPKCGGRLEEKISKSGKKFHKCENGRWNFMTKQNEGCDYVDWLEPKIAKPMDVRDYDDMVDPQDISI
jgi:predicted nucleic-acid-binding Zn-ribbon protein